MRGDFNIPEYRLSRAKRLKFIMNNVSAVGMFAIPSSAAIIPSIRFSYVKYIVHSLENRA